MPERATTFNFTAEGIKALKPDTKRVDYWDASLSGFGLRVTPNNVKTWFYWYRTGAVKRRWTIGRSPQISLADAREMARAAYGRDPAREKLKDAMRRPSGNPARRLYGCMPGRTRSRGNGTCGGSSTTSPRGRRFRRKTSHARLSKRSSTESPTLTAGTRLHRRGPSSRIHSSCCYT